MYPLYRLLIVFTVAVQVRFIVLRTFHLCLTILNTVTSLLRNKYLFTVFMVKISVKTQGKSSLLFQICMKTADDLIDKIVYVLKIMLVNMLVDK